MKREIRELGVIPPHIKEVVGWEAIAWHTAEWWRFQWEITELVDVTSARLQKDAWRDWLLWARAGAAHQPDGGRMNGPGHRHAHRRWRGASLLRSGHRPQELRRLRFVSSFASSDRDPGQELVARATWTGPTEVAATQNTEQQGLRLVAEDY
ncbi:hypothetical protein [Streptomyces cadmiisoli]|uniref:hypothetical protein n=1 Tax=Streptomyces cadmiisoli TaxID=2184053 RepID=UPI003D763159